MTTGIKLRKVPIWVLFTIGYCLLFSNNTFANYSWKQKANYTGSGRKAPIAFTMNNKGYFGTGYNGTINTKDFWEYDPATNVWTQKADYGGAGRHGAACFVIGTKGYAGLGTIGYPVYNFVKDIWEYDAVANSWTQKGNFPGAARYQSVSFTIGTKGYMGTGWDQTTPYYKDFWEYDATLDTWTQKANFGGTARLSAVGFTVNGKGYIGSGYDGAIKSDYWEYDPTGNTWVVKASFPGTLRYGLRSFVIGNLAYAGSGENGATIFNEFYSFNPTLNSWAPIASIPSGSGSGGSFSAGISGYVGIGSVIGGFSANFYEYSPDTLHITPSQTNVSCFGGNNGIASVSVTGGVSPYTYLWSSGQTTSSIGGRTAGTYTVTVTDANATTGTASVTITQPASAVTAGISGNLSFCSGASTSLNATSGGGTGAIGYLWNSGATTQSINVNTAATFTVTATDANGCTASASATTTVNPLPSCLITGSGSICSGSSTQWCAPAGLSSYSWSTGATTQCITVSSAGTYTVTVNNASGCSSSCNKVLTVNSLPSSSITGSGSICSGSSTQWCAPAGLASYLWSTGATTQCITVSVAGTYTTTVTNANGCSSSSSKSLTVGTSLSPVISGTLSICSGSTTQLCPQAFASYLWSTGATTQCITVSTAGTLTVTVSDASGCTGSASATTTVNPLPSCLITGSSSICSGSSTQWCAPVGLSSYTWSTGATTQCITVSSAGTYTVTVANASGCSSSCNKVLTVNGLPSSAITGSGSICSGSSTQWCAPAGLASYLWSTGATTQCITVSSAGTYTTTVTNANGCSSSSSKSLTVGAGLSPVIAGTLSICSGSSTQLCPQVFTSYLWSTGATTQCITVSTAGTFTVTVSDASGCTGSASATTTVNPLPSCLITGSSSICSGSSTQWCAPAGLSSYSWSTGATTQCITVSSAGTYTVTVSNASGCSSSCNKVLTVNSLPSSSITGSGSICSGSSSQWCAPVGLASYLWSTGATTQCITVSVAGTYTTTVTNANGCSSSSSKSLSTGSGLAPTISGTLSFCQGSSTQLCTQSFAAYIWSTGATTQCINVNTAGTFTVTVTDANGCTGSTSATTTIGANISCSISGNSTVCGSGSTQLCAPAGLASYLWSTGATTQCVTVPAGSYTVTVTNSGGCTGSCSKTITSGGTGSCTITGTGSICSNGSTQLCAPAGAASYAWSTGATTQCITVTVAGTYTATVVDVAGCSSTCSKAVTAGSAGSCTISGCGSSICQGQSVSICAPNGYASYSWSNGAHTRCINVSTAGTYTVIVTNSSGCTSSCSKTISVSTSPTCSITGSTSLCQGGSTQLCAPAGYYYTWSNGSHSRCITVNCAGTYTVTITNSSGCSSSCSKTVTVHSKPSCSISGSTSICPGGSTQLCAPAGYSYTWNNGSHSRCITVSSGGTYTVTVTNSTGCSSVCSKTVTVRSAPSCSITGNRVICHGQSTYLCAPSGCSSYQWSNGSHSRCITVSNAGTYTVTVTNSYGCTSSCNACVTIGSAREMIQEEQRSNRIAATVFPNPFSSTATIQFSSNDNPSHATVEVYDMTGIRVAILFDGEIEANEVHEVAFKAENYADGIYLYRITKGDEVLNGRMILIRE